MMRTAAWVTMTMMTAISGAAYAAPQGPCRDGALPANIDVSGDLARVLTRLNERSETFRSQCERIAEATTLHVTIRLVSRLPSGCRAFTTVRRSGRIIRAEMHLPALRGLRELIGHEFEHVVEQIEGLDLKRLARRRGSGVHEWDVDVFETDRAQQAGKLVAAEWENSPAAD